MALLFFARVVELVDTQVSELENAVYQQLAHFIPSALKYPH